MTNEKTDYLEFARALLEEAYQMSDNYPEKASVYASLSRAASQIAQVERLDIVTETFKASGKTYGSLMIVNRNAT